MELILLFIYSLLLLFLSLFILFYTYTYIHTHMYIHMYIKAIHGSMQYQNIQTGNYLQDELK